MGSRKWCLLGAFVFSFGIHAELSPEEIQAKVEKSDEGYRTLHPSAPVTIPGVSGAATPEEIEMNEKYYFNPKACKFSPSDVWDPWMTETERHKKIKKESKDYNANAKAFLDKCEEMRSEVGDGGCASVILGGHANGISSGLGKIFGYRLTEGTWEQIPSDQKIFEGIVSCLKNISMKKAPIIFASCGAGHVDFDYPEPKMHGYFLFYANKKEAQDLLSNILDRKVIGALGPENEQRYGKHSRMGWYISEPNSLKEERDFYNFRKHLPAPKVQWKNGEPVHDPGRFDFRSERWLTPQ